MLRGTYVKPAFKHHNWTLVLKPFTALLVSHGAKAIKAKPFPVYIIVEADRQDLTEKRCKQISSALMQLSLTCISFARRL